MSREEPSLASSVADMALLGQMFEEHQARLLAMLRRRLDPALATRLSPEDVLNDAFLVARRKWTAFRANPVVTPYAWLYRLVLDSLLEAWRRENRACRDPEREIPWPERSSMQLVLGLVGSGQSPSALAAGADLQRRMGEVLQLLKERDREILWMRHHDDLSFQEISAVLEVTANAARVRYVRALERLRELWRRLYPE